MDIVLELWAEIFKVGSDPTKSGKGYKWEKLSNGLVLVKITLKFCEEIVHVLAKNSQHTCLLDNELSLPNSEIKQTSECFVYWKDPVNHDVWGLNFSSAYEATEFKNIFQKYKKLKDDPNYSIHLPTNYSPFSPQTTSNYQTFQSGKLDLDQKYSRSASRPFSSHPKSFSDVGFTDRRTMDDYNYYVGPNSLNYSIKADQSFTSHCTKESQEEEGNLKRLQKFNLSVTKFPELSYKNGVERSGTHRITNHTDLSGNGMKGGSHDINAQTSMTHCKLERNGSICDNENIINRLTNLNIDDANLRWPIETNQSNYFNQFFDKDILPGKVQPLQHNVGLCQNRELRLPLNYCHAHTFSYPQTHVYWSKQHEDSISSAHKTPIAAAASAISCNYHDQHIGSKDPSIDEFGGDRGCGSSIHKSYSESRSVDSQNVSRDVTFRNIVKFHEGKCFGSNPGFREYVYGDSPIKPEKLQEKAFIEYHEVDDVAARPVNHATSKLSLSKSPSNSSIMISADRGGHLTYDSSEIRAVAASFAKINPPGYDCYSVCNYRPLAQPVPPHSCGMISDLIGLYNELPGPSNTSQHFQQSSRLENDPQLFDHLTQNPYGHSCYMTGRDLNNNNHNSNRNINNELGISQSFDLSQSSSSSKPSAFQPYQSLSKSATMPVPLPLQRKQESYHSSSSGHQQIIPFHDRSLLPEPQDSTETSLSNIRSKQHQQQQLDTTIQFSPYGYWSRAIRKTGWLNVKHWLTCKKNRLDLASKRSWKKYWVCLKGPTLLFYATSDPENSQAKKILHHMLIIEGAIVQAVPEHPKKENLFCMSINSGDVLLFQANSYPELENWITAIHISCAASLARHHGKENIVKILTHEIFKLNYNIEMDTRMKNMGEAQLTIVSDSNNRQAILKQIKKWEQRIEEMALEKYRFQCYKASLRNTELPNPKSLMVYSSKSMKTYFSKMSITNNVSSFHAYVAVAVQSSTNVPWSNATPTSVYGNNSVTGPSHQCANPNPNQIPPPNNQTAKSNKKYGALVGDTNTNHINLNDEISSTVISAPPCHKSFESTNSDNDYASITGHQRRWLFYQPNQKASSTISRNQSQFTGSLKEQDGSYIMSGSKSHHNIKECLSQPNTPINGPKSKKHHLDKNVLGKNPRINSLLDSNVEEKVIVTPDGNITFEDKIIKINLPRNEKIVVSINKEMTVEDLLLLVCEKIKLNSSEYFFKLRNSTNQSSTSHEYLVPDLQSRLINYNFGGIDLCPKSVFHVELYRPTLNQRYGFSIQAEICSKIHKPDELVVYVAEVNRDSIGYQKGLSNGDEILSINKKSVADLDMMYVETLLQQSTKVLLLIRSCQIEPPKRLQEKDFVTDLKEKIYERRRMQHQQQSSIAEPYGCHHPSLLSKSQHAGPQIKNHSIMTTCSNYIPGHENYQFSGNHNNNNNDESKAIEVPYYSKVNCTNNNTRTEVQHFESAAKNQTFINESNNRTTKSAADSNMNVFNTVVTTDIPNPSERIKTVMTDFLKNERVYCVNLNFVYENYILPIWEDFQNAATNQCNKGKTSMSSLDVSLSSRNNMIDNIQGLIDTIRDIITFQQTFLGSLCRAVSRPSTDSEIATSETLRDDENFDVTPVADIFAKFSPFFKLYSTLYSAYYRVQRYFRNNNHEIMVNTDTLMTSKNDIDTAEEVPFKDNEPSSTELIQEIGKSKKIATLESQIDSGRKKDGNGNGVPTFEGAIQLAKKHNYHIYFEYLLTCVLNRMPDYLTLIKQLITLISTLDQLEDRTSRGVETRKKLKCSYKTIELIAEHINGMQRIQNEFGNTFARLARDYLEKWLSNHNSNQQRMNSKLHGTTTTTKSQENFNNQKSEKVDGAVETLNNKVVISTSNVSEQSRLHREEMALIRATELSIGDLLLCDHVDWFNIPTDGGTTANKSYTVLPCILFIFKTALILLSIDPNKFKQLKQQNVNLYKKISLPEECITHKIFILAKHVIKLTTLASEYDSLYFWDLHYNTEGVCSKTNHNTNRNAKHDKSNLIGDDKYLRLSTRSKQLRQRFLDTINQIKSHNLTGSKSCDDIRKLKMYASGMASNVVEMNHDSSDNATSIILHSVHAKTPISSIQNELKEDTLPNNSSQRYPIPNLPSNTIDRASKECNSQINPITGLPCVQQLNPMLQQHNLNAAALSYSSISILSILPKLTQTSTTISSSQFGTRLINSSGANDLNRLEPPKIFRDLTDSSQGIGIPRSISPIWKHQTSSGENLVDVDSYLRENFTDNHPNIKATNYESSISSQLETNLQHFSNNDYGTSCQQQSNYHSYI